MVHPVTYGKRVRMSYSRIDEVLDLPDLTEVQKSSYQWFIEEGLQEVFDDISPIQDYTGNLILEFIDYHIEEDIKYSEDEARERDANFSAPLKAKIRLINKETGEVKEQEVFMGDLPLMTEKGTFIINGAERVVVSQLVRSPGVYYVEDIDKTGKRLYSSTLIPNRGAWLEFESDSNDIVYVRVDRTRKVPITILLRALKVSTDSEIIAVLGETEQVLSTLEKDSIGNDSEVIKLKAQLDQALEGVNNQGNGTEESEEILNNIVEKLRTEIEGKALVEIYKRLRPGEPPTVDSARTLINNLFFDPRRYDLAKVGRYKFNKKLALYNRIYGKESVNDIHDLETGEILITKGEKITREQAIEIENKGINAVDVLLNDGKSIRVVGNHFVSPEAFDLSFSVADLGLREKIYYPLMKELIDTYEDPEELKEAISERVRELSPKHITIEDIVASINYEMNLFNGVGITDDIDHLGNRRLRSVGELLQNQFRIGLSRMERVVRERMTIQDIDVATPQDLINIRPVVASIKEFFGSSQLSQFMDQTNPLAELTHKRRMSALGPGGLSRDRAGFAVRDVHHSHYGRMCPIETPEGPNIGLITSLTTYARINEYGFLEAPYRKVEKGTSRTTGEIDYITADVEDEFTIAQSNERLNSDGTFVNKRIVARGKGGVVDIYPSEEVDYMDVSPRQIVSVGTAMIPFLENDDGNRALMGANMQRQAVPLLKTEAPIIGTGIEYKAAKDSGVVVISRAAGVVEKVSASEIVIRRDDNNQLDRYRLLKFQRSNQGTTINQRPMVVMGEKVKANEVIADGPSTDLGEIALGKNILIAFMTWEGYNFEDAILINENIVKEDTLTSVHIEEYESEARDTKLGPEEITRDIPNVGDDMLKELDERGIIRIGAEVKSGDILVGKVTPKGETELTAEERLLRAIFGEKAREVRDTSLRVPHGEAGIIVDVKIFSRENGDELPPGVNQMVRVYIATKRKINVGDKMCGRHGNKGVVSMILPEEDMPYLPDGTPIQIVLNPLGVPSRMNLGQVLEVHLGLAAKKLGWHVATPVFDGASDDDILSALRQADYPESGKLYLRDGRTGEYFNNPVTVGYMYMLKLHHLVDDKIHARSTGPYSLVTQQPLGGKAQFGGQRFGEMEVWALEAYGAAHTLQEILTVKSDDIVGRVKTYEAIVKGENIPEPGIPESFKVLIKELQSLALDIKILTEEKIEIEIEESLDDELSELEAIGEETVEEKIFEDDKREEREGIARIEGHMPSGFILEEDE